MNNDKKNSIKNIENIELTSQKEYLLLSENEGLFEDTDTFKIQKLFSNFFESSFLGDILNEFMKILEDFKDAISINAFYICMFAFLSSVDEDILTKVLYQLKKELTEINKEFATFTKKSDVKKYFKKNILIQQKMIYYSVQNKLYEVSKFLLKYLKFKVYEFTDWFYKELYSNKEYKILDLFVKYGSKQEESLRKKQVTKKKYILILNFH